MQCHISQTIQFLTSIKKMDGRLGFLRHIKHANLL